MAVSTTEPLCQPCVYHEDFKGFCLLPQNLTTPLLSSSSTPQRVDAGSQAVVTPLSEALHRVDVELQVRRPLMPVRLSPEQVGLEMLCLCGQLDLLIRAQMQQFQEQLGQGCSPEESDTFQSEGSEILDQMLQCLEHLPKPMPQLEDYLDMVGLSAMFPRVEVFLIQGSPVDMLDRPLMDEYFFHVAKLNQLLVLSQQLEEDIRHLGSHKYIAHQLSVIYQVISSFRGIQVFSKIKKDIETNFKQMKQSLMAEEGCRHEPQLTAHYISWILEITKGLTSLVLSLPEELTEDLHQAFTFVSQFLS